jgi:hypothetical protein
LADAPTGWGVPLLPELATKADPAAKVGIARITRDKDDVVSVVKRFRIFSPINVIDRAYSFRIFLDRSASGSLTLQAPSFKRG